MPVFFLEPFKKISFPVRPEAETVKQTGKVFRGGGWGPRGLHSFKPRQQPLQREASETEKALAISRKGLIVWLPETDLNRQPSD